MIDVEVTMMMRVTQRCSCMREELCMMATLVLSSHCWHDQCFGVGETCLGAGLSGLTAALWQVLVSETARITELALSVLLPVVAHTSSTSLEESEVPLIILTMCKSALVTILASLALGP